MNVLIFFLLVFLFWQFFADFIPSLHFILPKPAAVFHEFFQRSDFFLWHTFVTLREILFMVLFAVLLAFFLAALMQRFAKFAKVLGPIFVFLQSLPLFCLAPFFVICFGWSFFSVVFAGALMLLAPLTLHFFQGFTSVPKRYLESFAIYQASAWQIFWQLKFPFAFRYLFTALRIAAVNAGICAVSAEWAGAQEGLGLLMYQSQRISDLEASFISFLLLSFLSGALYWLATFFEKKWLLTSLLLLMLCSCEKEKTELLLDWFPNPNHVPLYYGIEQGYFKDEGIDLELKILADPSMSLTLLQAKKAQIALYYMPEAILAKSKKAKSKNLNIKYLGSLVPRPLDAILCAKSSQTIKDLHNQSFAYSFGGLNEQYLSWVFNEQKIQAKNVQGLSFSLSQALLSGRVAAIFGLCYNIQQHELRAKGLETQAFHFCDLGLPKYEELVFFTTQEVLEKEPDFRLRFMKALQKSIEACRKEPEKAFAAYLKKNPKATKTIAWEREAFEESLALYADEQFFRQELWQNFATWLWQGSFIDCELDVRDFF